MTISFIWIKILENLQYACIKEHCLVKKGLKKSAFSVKSVTDLLNNGGTTGILR